MTDTIYKVTIQMLVIAEEGDNPQLWLPPLLAEHLLDYPGLHISTTSEVATFASEQPKAEAPTAEVVPLFQATSPAKSHTLYLGKRVYRPRKKESVPGLKQFEYRYISADYIKHARQLDAGTHSKSQGKRCVWLTKDEAKCVGAAAAADRRKRKTRHIETNTQALGGAK